MKTIQVLLPDNLHEQLQQKASEAGFDLSAYILALLAEDADPRTRFPKVTGPGPQPAQTTAPLPQPPALSGVQGHPRTPLTQQPGGANRPRSSMAVVIRWDLLGKGDRETIRASTAAATLVHVVSRLDEVLGADTLKKLAEYRVSRGPLVSDNPGRDFVNGRNGDIYTNHPIPGTNYCVLTHSSTAQKMQDLKKLHRYLGLPVTFFEVTMHD